MAEGRPPGFRRILVALDASPHSFAALEAAAEMAAGLEAELFGLFVEDINLLRLAELPFAQEVSPLHAGMRRELDRPTMERALRVAARRAREAMAAVIGRRPVRWSFRVARGRVVTELLSAAVEADVLALGKAGADFAARLGLGSTALSVLRNAPCAVLLLSRGVRLRPPVVVVVGNGAASPRAVEAGAALASACGQDLVVLIRGTDTAVANRLRTQLAEMLEPFALAVTYRQISGTGAGGIIRAVAEAHAGALVMDLESPALGEAGFKTLMETVDCPVLLARGVTGGARAH
ncbi:MAG TPA: universal stress protein [Opitutaceae bacterium]